MAGLSTSVGSWSSLRTTIVGELLAGVVAELGPGPLRIVDAGGGTGGFAVPLAVGGHHVTVVDPSPDAIAALDRRYAEQAHGSAAAGSIRAVQGDLAGLLDVVPPGGADLVLCHNVLEIVEEPVGALATLRAVLRPGGIASLLVAGRGGAVVGRALAGRFAEALALVRGATFVSAQANGAPEGYFVADLHTDLVTAGFTITATHAVRVFSDLVPGAVLDGEPGARSALLDLERAVADRADYLALAGQLHVVARRDELDREAGPGRVVDGRR